jgi:hypothetical protein
MDMLKNGAGAADVDKRYDWKQLRSKPSFDSAGVETFFDTCGICCRQLSQAL